MAAPFIVGGRGVTLHQYYSIGGPHLSDLYSAAKFPDSPDYYSVNPSFQPDFTRYESLSVDLLEFKI